MAPLYQRKLVTVDPTDILPKKKKEDLAEKSRNQFYTEVTEEMQKAGDRFIKVVIEPQKKIIMDEYYNHDTPNTFIEKTFNRLDKLNDTITDLRAEVGENFDRFKAEESVKDAMRRGINTYNPSSKGIDEFFEYDMLKDKGIILDPKKNFTKYDNVDSLLWDDDQPINKKQSKIKEFKPIEPDSYDIDPSLFD